MAAADIFNSNDMMAGPVPPPLLLEQQQPEEVADLDQHFGQMLCKLMDGQLTAADAISQLAQRSGDVVKYYRYRAARDEVLTRHGKQLPLSNQKVGVLHNLLS